MEVLEKIPTTRGRSSCNLFQLPHGRQRQTSRSRSHDELQEASGEFASSAALLGHLTLPDDPVICLGCLTLFTPEHR